MTSPGSGISQQIQNWSNANSNLQSVNNFYKTELQYLMSVVIGQQHNPALALWLFQTQCMPSATQSCEYNMQLESDALNIANDLRNDITNAQNDYNSMINDIENGNKAGGVAAAAALSNALQKLKDDLDIKNLSKILSRSTISSLKGFIANISSAIHDPNKYHPQGGQGIYSYMNAIYSAAVNGNQGPDQPPGGMTPPQFGSITSAFNNLNQSVSGISSAIQAQMQFLNQNLQQYFGIYKSFFDDYSQLSSYIINKTTGS